MAKIKTAFYCTECGNETPKWQGRCLPAVLGIPLRNILKEPRRRGLVPLLV